MKAFAKIKKAKILEKGVGIYAEIEDIWNNCR